jgi:phage-related protein
MATFPSIKPTYGQQKRSAPNTRTVRFADGYEHRILFGLAQHQNPKIFNFTFNVSETDCRYHRNFLRCPCRR